MPLLLSSFPQTVPHEFVDQVVTAADENKDGRISVDEMSVMLRNIYSLQPISREEVQYIMERDLGMNPEIEDSVPMEKVKQLLLEIYHWKAMVHTVVSHALQAYIHSVLIYSCWKHVYNDWPCPYIYIAIEEAIRITNS